MHRCKHPADLSPSATSTTAHPRSHVVNFGLRCCVQEAKAAWNAALQCADAHTDIQLLLDLSLALKDPQAAKVGGWPTSEEPHSRQAHTGISCACVSQSQERLHGRRVHAWHPQRQTGMACGGHAPAHRLRLRGLSSPHARRAVEAAGQPRPCWLPCLSCWPWSLLDSTYSTSSSRR